jgi:hypothetical protein
MQQYLLRNHMDPSASDMQHVVVDQLIGNVFLCTWFFFVHMN